jgi:DNA repair protein RecO (recombination protein O)
MLESRKGIICRSIKYGESSLISDIFTEETGMRSYIISGVRTKTARTKAVTMQVMNLVDFIAYDSKDAKSGLIRIKEIQFDCIYKGIPFDVVKSSIGLFLIEVFRKSVRKNDQNKELFAFIKDRFLSLDSLSIGIGHFHIQFLIALAAELGFAIENNHSTIHKYFNLSEGYFSESMIDHRYCLDDVSSAYLSLYLKGGDLSQVPKTYRKALLTKLVDFYRYHIEDFGELKSLDVLNSLYG